MGRTLKMKVSATSSALSLLSELKEKYGEKLMFHQSGGCCDGSAPMCFQEGEFPLGENDIKLGETNISIAKIFSTLSKMERAFIEAPGHLTRSFLEQNQGVRKSIYEVES